jgi:hypothetical protein
MKELPEIFGLGCHDGLSAVNVRTVLLRPQAPQVAGSGEPAFFGTQQPV